MTAHTILLIQQSKNKNSRTFSDFETVALAVEGVIKMYEVKLTELNPTVRNFTYDVKDLHAYIDHLGDLCALVFDPQLKAYVPHDREWVKQKVLNHLKKVAGLR